MNNNIEKLFPQVALSGIVDQYYNMFNKHVKEVTFIVTHDCSLRCSYCYEHGKDRVYMSKETAKNCVDNLFIEDEKQSMCVNNVIADGIILTFTGGEPLLNIEVIEHIVDYFLDQAILKNHRWSTNFMLGITSNGTHYFNECVQNFIDKYSRKITVSITVDGNKALHDSCRKFPDGSPSYDIAFKAAEHAKKRFNQIGTKLTIAPDNLPFLFEAVKDLVINLNAKFCMANPVFEAGWNLNHAILYYKELKKLADWLIETERYQDTYVVLLSATTGYRLPDTETQNWCGGTGLMLAFDVDGSAYPCVRYAPVSLGKEKAKPVKIGDCYNGLLNTRGQEDFVQELKCITRQSQSEQKCLDCPINAGCAWCSAYNYEVTGSANKRLTYICQMHQARCMATSYYYNKLCKEVLKIDARYEFNIPKDWALEIIDENEYNMLLTLSK